jgi:hypothetical protein
MKLILRAFIIYISTFPIIVIIQSCCEDDHRIVGQGTIGAYAPYYNDLNKIDIINGTFLIFAQLELKTTMLMDNINIIQRSYAMTCEDNFNNEINPSTLKLTCNKDFTFNNTTISAGDDFVNTDGLEIDISNEWGSIEIRFTQDFIDLANFSKDMYQFTIGIETNDGLRFKNNVDLYMNL